MGEVLANINKLSKKMFLITFEKLLAYSMVIQIKLAHVIMEISYETGAWSEE